MKRTYSFSVIIWICRLMAIKKVPRDAAHPHFPFTIPY